jgi:hypothetical protein
VAGILFEQVLCVVQSGLQTIIQQSANSSISSSNMSSSTDRASSSKRQLLVLVVWLLAIEIAHTKGSAEKHGSMLTKKEFELAAKKLLTDWKVRKVPEAQSLSEIELGEKLKEERELLDQIEKLKREVKSMGGPSGHDGKPSPSPSDSAENNNPRGLRLKFAELTRQKLLKTEEELKKAEEELENTKEQIRNLKAIIKSPSDFIRIPVYRNDKPPEEVQQEERNLLIHDREVMARRVMILKREVKAEEMLIMVDEW